MLILHVTGVKIPVPTNCIFLESSVNLHIFFATIIDHNRILLVETNDGKDLHLCTILDIEFRCKLF